jgi:glyoxylase-like metal-dependent hydrolase (beta-lactamase superfamily II)
MTRGDRDFAPLAELDATEVTPGVWRWTAFHAEWGEEVASVAVAGEADGQLVLIDPLIPVEAAPRFWGALDGTELSLAVVVTVFWHRRSACEIVERCGTRATLWASERERERIGGLVTRPFEAPADLPAGLVAMPTARPGEVVLWLPRARALIPGDVLLGGKRKPLRVCPSSWLPAGLTRQVVARSLEPLLELPVERILCSHGEPVVEDAHAVLTAAIRDAAPPAGTQVSR